jgi:predicted esterase
MSLNVLRVKAPAKATSSVIIMHGLGDSADGWKFLSDMLHKYEQFQSVNFIFPNAPIKPLTVAGGQPISQWFDIFEMGNPNARQDEDGYWNSVAKISNLIDDEVNNGIDPSKIIVGGFSQGASISLGVNASYDKRLAGVLCLSGFFGMKQGMNSRLQDINKQTNILHGHGDLDPMINIAYARSTAKYFKDLGFSNYNLKEYPGMAHSTCNEELSDIAEFITKNLSL